MIINNIGINFAGGGGGSTGGSCTLTSATFTANSAYTPTDADGWSAVTVSVDMSAPYSSGFTEGYNSGETAGIAEQKALLSSTTITENGSFSAENGYSAVTVNVTAGEDKLSLLFRNGLTAVTAQDLSGVTSIRDYQFYGLSNLKSVELPNSVTTVFRSAFEKSGIETINLSNVSSYGPNTFSECYSLTGVTGLENYTGDSVSNMFSGCTALTGNLSLGMKPASSSNFQRMFYNCKNLKSVTWLQNQVISNYNSGYSGIYNGCTSMEYIDYLHNWMVPELKYVNPFSSFTANYEIRVPQAIYDAWTAATNWSNSAIVDHIVGYPGAYEVKTLQYTTSDGNDITPNIPYSSATAWSGTYLSNEFDATTGGTVNIYGPVNVAAGAYSGKTTLKSFVVPDGATKIDLATFRDSGLVSISLPNSISVLSGEAFTNCSSLTGITIPDGISSDNQTAWSSNIFSGCTSLEQIVFGEGITSIEASQSWLRTLLLVSPALTAVTFGSRLGRINLTFNSNASVSDITFKSSTHPLRISYSVNGVASEGTIHVPVNASSEYEGWIANDDGLLSAFSGWTIVGDVV